MNSLRDNTAWTEIPIVLAGTLLACLLWTASCTDPVQREAGSVTPDAGALTNVIVEVVDHRGAAIEGQRVHFYNSQGDLLREATTNSMGIASGRSEDGGPLLVSFEYSSHQIVVLGVPAGTHLLRQLDAPVLPAWQITPTTAGSSGSEQRFGACRGTSDAAGVLQVDDSCLTPSGLPIVALSYDDEGVAMEGARGLVGAQSEEVVIDSWVALSQGTSSIPEELATAWRGAAVSLRLQDGDSSMWVPEQPLEHLMSTPSDWGEVTGWFATRGTASILQPTDSPPAPVPPSDVATVLAYDFERGHIDIQPAGAGDFVRVDIANVGSPSARYLQVYGGAQSDLFILPEDTRQELSGADSLLMMSFTVDREHSQSHLQALQQEKGYRTSVMQVTSVEGATR